MTLYVDEYVHINIKHIDLRSWYLDYSIDILIFALCPLNINTIFQIVLMFNGCY